MEIKQPRMDGDNEEKLLWRISALREALREIGGEIADNALLVDDGNKKLCSEV